MRVEDALVAASAYVRPGLKSLVRTLVKAETTPQDLTAADFTPNPAVWTAMQADQMLRQRLTNEYVLGLGWDAAPVIVMGTEAADNIVGSWADLAFQSLLPALIVAGSPGPLTDALYTAYPESKRDRSAARLYHVEPWDWVSGATITSRNTWACVADAVSPAGWRELLRGPRGPTRVGRTRLSNRAQRCECTEGCRRLTAER